MSGRRISARAAALALLRASQALGEPWQLIAEGRLSNTRTAYHAFLALRVAYEQSPSLQEICFQWDLWQRPNSPALSFFAGFPVDHALVARIVAEIAA